MAEFSLFPTYAPTNRMASNFTPNPISNIAPKQDVCVEVEVELRLPVQKLWEALMNINNVVSKLPFNMNHKVLTGNSGVGSVSLMQLADGVYETERVDVVDEQKHVLISTVVQLQETQQGHQVYTKTVTLTSVGNGATTIVRWRAEGALAVAASDTALKLFKALETYLS